MMSIERISVGVVVLTVTIIVSNTVRCTTTSDVATVILPKAPISTTLPASSAPAKLSDEQLDVLKNFHSPLPEKVEVLENVHSPLPGKGPQTPGTAPNSPPPLVTDRIPIMHFTAAPALGSVDGDQSSRSSANPVATTNPIVAQGPQLHHPERPVGQDPQTPDRGNDLMAVPLTGKTFPVSVLPPPPPPPIAVTDPSPAAHPQSHSSDPAPLKIEPIRLSPNFNHELSKLLTDLRMNSSTLHETTALALDKDKILAPGQATRPAETLQPLVISPGAPGAAPAPPQPPKVRRPILAPNQTPLDYLLSSSSPMLYHSNSVLGRFTPNTSTNPSPTVHHHQPPSTSAKPRPNLQFVKYLLTLPRYQQALYDLIEAQSSTQT